MKRKFVTPIAMISLLVMFFVALFLYIKSETDKAEKQRQEFLDAQERNEQYRQDMINEERKKTELPVFEGKLELSDTKKQPVK